MCKVKIPKKCPKSAFSTKNHDFFKVGIRARMADIWPEICIWDVLDTFYVLFWYIEVIWCIFGKIEKNAFFCLFLAVDRHAKSIFFNFRPDNRIITFAPPSASISPFPVRFARVISTCLARNLIFYLRVALLVKPIYYRFVQTSSTHGPHIKSTSRAISQYIHCWEYFQWVKSYTYLKFHAMRVTHLWLSASYEIVKWKPCISSIG